MTGKAQLEESNVASGGKQASGTAGVSPEEFAPNAGKFVIKPSTCSGKSAAKGGVASIARVRKGVGVATLERLKAKLAISDRELARLLRVSERTLDRRRQERKLDTDLSDHTVALLDIFSATLKLFEGNEAAARRWLKSPERALGNKMPMELIELEAGRNVVKDLIGRLEHGIFS
ncbi:type II RES/Xre toxin-antitoxin system antitoxin [Marinobacter bohaiensis]|uniref:type II RES/Xre toxin-antitoxin system antitoxin n=1 Tax=Marinobacter bohaiensis TaxID=2201898 RepID=UPI0013A6F9C6|nr:antitoxin Xre/MbcA/ParS toxin-binding domain-containing protein [Marinobacter bohaiensis]